MEQSLQEETREVLEPPSQEVPEVPVPGTDHVHGCLFRVVVSLLSLFGVLYEAVVFVRVQLDFSSVVVTSPVQEGTRPTTRRG